MGVLNECLAKPHVFEHKGRKYKVSLVNQKIKLQYEQAMFARAKEAAIVMKELMSGDDYRAHLKQLNDDYLIGAYGMDSERGLQTLKSTWGGITLIALLFGVDNHEAVQLLTERKDDVTALLQVILHESFPAMEEGAEKKVEETGTHQ